MMGSWIGCHGRGIGLFGDVGRGYDGRCLRVWPWDCVWGAQGHNEQMAAGGSPGSGRGKKRPTPPALLGTEPESRGGAVAALCACSSSSALGVPVPPSGKSQNCTHRSTASPTPARSNGCCSTDGTYRPGLVRNMALFPEGSALRTWAQPGLVWLSCWASEHA